MRRWRLILAIPYVLAGALIALGAQTFAQSGDDGRYVVVGVILYDKMLGQEVYVYNASGYATATPGDPVATATPEPTRTPSATPTPESGITSTPDGGAPKVCLATTGAALNLRQDHSTSAAIIDNIDPAARMEVLAFWVVEDVTNEWVKVRTLTRSGAVRTGWVFRGASVLVGVDDTEELCWDVPVDGPGTAPTPAPTATPLPGPTPITGTPQPGDCLLTSAYTMTIRSGWTTGSARVGALPAGAPASVGHLYPNTATEQWAFVTHNNVTGWVAVRTGGADYSTLSGDCSKVRRDKPRAGAPLAGPHVLVGAQNTLAGYAEQFSTYKCLTHSEGICLAAKARNPDLVIVYRTLHVSDGMRDCPDYNEWLSPDVWYRKMRPHWAEGFDYYEVINECAPPSPRVMVDFSIRVAQLAAADGKAILAFAYYPGAPELADWDVLYDYLRWADEHPLPDGRHHGLALHAAGYAPAEQVPPDSWINDVWVAGRHTLINARLLAVHGYSLKQFRGPIFITELGWDDGYQSLGLGSLGWDCAQYALAVAETRRALAAQGIVDGFHIWNFGSGGTTRWVDLSPCASQIAAGV